MCLSGKSAAEDYFFSTLKKEQPYEEKTVPKVFCFLIYSFTIVLKFKMKLKYSEKSLKIIQE